MMNSTRSSCLTGVIISIITLSLHPRAVVMGYHRRPCPRSVAKQFQFPDCYVPNINKDTLLLSEASFVMSHDAATGYLPSQSTLPPKPISPLGIVSFGSLKPLTGQLTHSCSVESATSMATASSSYSQESSSSRFRDYQAEQWHERFEELRQFVEKHGHCQISHKDPEHNALARWSKRQRYQFKLLRDGKPSTMTEERIVALNGLGFAWNSHEGNYQLMD